MWGGGPEPERGAGLLPPHLLLPHVGIWFCSAAAKQWGKKLCQRAREQGPFVCSGVCLLPGPGTASQPWELTSPARGTLCDREKAWGALCSVGKPRQIGPKTWQTASISPGGAGQDPSCLTPCPVLSPPPPSGWHAVPYFSCLPLPFLLALPPRVSRTWLHVAWLPHVSEALGSLLSSGTAQ